MDLGRMALGFAGGALTGYSAVLQTKMKEDYENRMEEARLERQKNYARWTDINITDPNREAEQKFSMEQQGRGFTHAEKLQKQGFTHAETMQKQSFAHSEAMTQKQIAAADARYNRENSPEAIQKKAMAIYDAQIAVAGKEADKLYNLSIQNGMDQTQASLLKSDFILSGASNREEYNKLKASANNKAWENAMDIAKAPTQKSWEAIDQQATESPNDFLENATKQFGKKFASVQEAVQYSKQVAATTNLALARNTVSGKQGSDNQPTTERTFTEDYIGQLANAAIQYNPSIATDKQKQAWETAKSDLSKASPADQARVAQKIEQLQNQSKISTENRFDPDSGLAYYLTAKREQNKKEDERKAEERRKNLLNLFNR